MAAIAEKLSPGESAVLAVRAGCDLLLACRHAEKQFAMLDHLRRAAENGFLAPDLLAASVLRVETLLLAAACRVPDLADARAVLGCAEHRRVRERMVEALSIP
jgi:beta-glucosidase-like glycosyl hydrolase